MKIFIIIGLILLAVIVLLVSLKRRKLVINKTVVILAVVGIGAYLFLGMIESDGENETKHELPKYEQSAPRYEDAPYVLPTPSRTYYVVTFKDSDESLVLTNYYYCDGDDWELTSDPLPFDKSLPEFKELKVYKRSTGS